MHSNTEKVEIEGDPNTVVEDFINFKPENKENVSSRVNVEVLALGPAKKYKKKTAPKLNKTNAQNNVSKVLTNELSPEQILQKEFFSKQIEDIAKKIDSAGSKKYSSKSKKKRIEKRKEVRYEFYPIEAKLNKKTMPGVSKTLDVLVINVSSKGALIELDNPLKLRGKVTLYVKFDADDVFVIQSIIVRNKGKMLYGLNFLDLQHEFLDFLVNSGRSFSYA